MKMNRKPGKMSPLTEALVACKVMFKYALLFGCIVNVLMLATPIYSMQVLDRVISSGSTDTLLYLTLVIGFAILLLGLIQMARSFAMNKMGGWFEHVLSDKIFSNSVRTALVSKSGGSQHLRDLQTIKTFLTSPNLVSMMDVPWAVIFIIVLFFIHPVMGILTVGGGVVLVVLAFTADKMTKHLHESSNEVFISSMKQVDQATRNAEVIEVMGMLGNVNRNWQETNKRLQQVQSLVTNRQTTMMEVTKFLRTFLQILTTGIGAYLVLLDQMSTGGIIACSSLSGRALAPFESAVQSIKAFVNARKAYQRVEDSLEKYEEETGKMSLPTPVGRITAENLYFAPAGSAKHVIKGMTFALEPGESLGIIGPSASGKTTLAKLLVGVWVPQIGSVRVDNAVVNDWKREELGAYVGYLPQDIELFGGTIRDNIARLDKNAKDEDVIKAAQIAGIHDMVLLMPKGYDTEIGFDGTTLSGGQKQRIGLARAFYGDPKILVLDEPNANLDSFGEIALAQAIARAKERNITTIIISHRTSILGGVDKILAVKDGMVALFGSRDEVMEKMNQAAKAAVPFDVNRKRDVS